MGGACATYERGKRCVQGFGGETWERDHWGDPDVDGKIIFSLIFKKWDEGYGIDRAGLG
jgi:hypothetical protein